MATKEEEFHRCVWGVLKKIKGLILSSGDEVIKYRITKELPFYEKDAYLGFDREMEIINKLVKEKIITRNEDKDYISEFNTSADGKELPFFVLETLKVNIKEFDQFYSNYENMRFDNAETGRYFLEIRIDGTIVLLTPIGKKYQTKLNSEDNVYQVLAQWATYPYQIVSAGDLAKRITKPARENTNAEMEEKVYNAVTSLRKSLALPKDIGMYVFEKDDKRYQLRASALFI